MDTPLLFLIKLAWACRYRLPILITFAFMALDIRMQLEIHVQMRRIHRNSQPIQNNRQRGIETLDNASNDSSSSWVTLDEEDDVDSEIVHGSTRENLESASSQNVNV